MTTIILDPNTYLNSMPAAEMSDGSISSEGEPPIRKLYRKPHVKKRRFNATNDEHPRKIYGVNKQSSDSTETPNDAPTKEENEDVNLSSPALTTGGEIDSAWHAFIVAYELFWCCCGTISQAWNGCGKKDTTDIKTENGTQENEVIIQIEDDGETEF